MENFNIAEVVGLAQSGDKKAFETLYNEYAKATYFLALHALKNEKEAEDITQDVFLTVLNGLGTLKNPKIFRLG